MRGTSGWLGRRSGCPFSGITLAISPVMVLDRLHSDDRQGDRLSSWREWPLRPGTRTTDPAGRCERQGQRAFSGAGGRKRGSDTNFLQRRVHGIRANRKLESDPVFLRGTTVDCASIKHAAGTRQAVPGRADLWGGGAARAWALRATAGSGARCEPLTRGSCLSGTFRCSELNRERPCPPRTSEAGTSNAKWKPTQDEALPGNACRAPRTRTPNTHPKTARPTRITPRTAANPSSTPRRLPA